MIPLVSVSERERISHVLRRLSLGAHPTVVAGLPDVDAALARALDLSPPPATVPLGTPPTAVDAQRPIEIVGTIGWWLDQMRTPDRMVEERLVWFWHDHFATSIAKVRVPYLMAQQHATIRAHATGSFSDLLHAIAKDPAMLLYLDGVTNAVGSINENFGRECLELFTLGIGGGYTQQDVVEASRAFSGWAIHIPGRPSARLGDLGVAPWQSTMIRRRHDQGTKQLLGSAGAFDLDGAIDVILSRPATARFIAGKLHRELVGLDADDATAQRLGRAFRRDWSIMGLVEAIVDDPAFTSDAAVRARVRTPVEKLVGILQAAGNPPLDLTSVTRPGVGGDPARRSAAGVASALRSIGFIPFVPPNVGGFAGGAGLLGPHQLVHTIDLLQALSTPPPVPDDPADLLARFGLFDVSRATRDVVGRERDPGRRFALVALSPEFAVT